VLVAASAAGVCRAAGAQAARPAVAPGATVRVEAPALGRGRGAWDVAGVRRDTLLLRSAGGGPPTAVALADVTRLEVNRGPLRNTLLGGAAGLVLGAAAGAAYGRSRPGPFADVASCVVTCTAEDRARARQPAPGDWATLGAVPGLVLGAVVGGVVVGDRWRRVAAGPARVAVAPGARGAARVVFAASAR
jgi:hypothetical protein